MIESIRSFIHMLSLNQKDCEKYCREKRIHRYERYQGGHITCLKLHSLAHMMLMPFLKLFMCLDGNRLTVLRDARIKTDKPIIFCPTHIGGVDVEMSFLAIHEPCWALLGDPRELYRTFDGFMLEINGVIPMDVDVKEDRMAARAQMEELLRKGGNLLIFPEGVQNISANALINPLFPGAVELAIECRANIVPIAICRDKNRYYVNIGENISYDNCDYNDRYRCTEELRDKMATLKWEIIEQLPGINRMEICDTAYNDFVSSVFTLGTSYTWTIEDIQKGIYKPKNVVDSKEVFSFMDKIVPSVDNAFLYDHRLKM